MRARTIVLIQKEAGASQGDTAPCARNHRGYCLAIYDLIYQSQKCPTLHTSFSPEEKDWILSFP